MAPTVPPAPSATKLEPWLARCDLGVARSDVDVAVSGGPDSSALLALAVAAGLRVRVHHVHHGLRPDAGADADWVAQVCRAWDVEHLEHRVEVTPGANLEARARDARRRALPLGCLTGHTADDRAETVVLALLRGTGSDGLAGPDPRTRPLLGLRRADTEAVCAAVGLAVRRDPMNTDRRFARVRVRLDVIPALSAAAGRDVVPLLCRTAALAGAERPVLEAAAESLDPCDAAALAGAPLGVARRAVRRWWRVETGSAHPPGEAAVERVLGVARGSARATDVAAGWRVRRHRGRLELSRPAVADG